MKFLSSQQSPSGQKKVNSISSASRTNLCCIRHSYLSLRFRFRSRSQKVCQPSNVILHIADASTTMRIDISLET